MTVTLCILRHGRAMGQGPDALLGPEGEAYVARLGRKLAGSGLRPVAAYSSPYRRARETASIVLGELASDARLTFVPDLAPDVDAAEALGALQSHGLPEGHVLVVSHLPLVATLARSLADVSLDFQPGTYAEIELAPGGVTGALRRFIGPNELDGT